MTADFMAGRRTNGRAESKGRETPVPSKLAETRHRAARRARFSAAAALVGAAALATATTMPSRAAPDYPTKPVRIFVPYGPGGVGDLTMRLMADQLSRLLKQQFVIENRPGAGGIVAMTGVLHAPADGYTLGEMGNGQSISMSLFNHLPFDVLNDFTQVSLAASFELLLAVPDNSPYKTLKDLVGAAQKNPGKLNLGAINPGSTQNLSAHLFEQVTGAGYTIVPFRTTPDLVTALLRGDVDLGFDYFAGFGPMIGSGKLRIMATSGEQRDPLLKDVPTAKESGFPNYVVLGWNGVAARAGTPTDIVDLLSDAITRGLAAPEVQEKSRALGIDAHGSTPQEMHDRMAADIAKWRGVIEKAHIPKE
jgi:tripartite-type tricarboxylate transporter receptor subunit TctC